MIHLMHRLREWLQNRHEDTIRSMASYPAHEDERERQQRKQREAELEQEIEARVQRIEDELHVRSGGMG